MEELQVGDVVRLKSGSPKMSVKAFGQHPNIGIVPNQNLINIPQNFIVCEWFNGKKDKFQEHIFYYYNLRKVKSKKSR